METVNASFKRIIYLRHALWEANVLKREHRENKHPGALKEIKLNPEFIDSPIHAQGVEQIEILKEVFSKENIQICLISPLRRAMTTCLESMSAHPQFKEIKFIIHPFLKGGIAGFMDIPSMSLEVLRNEYEEKYGVKINIADEELSTFRDWKKGL